MRAYSFTSGANEDLTMSSRERLPVFMAAIEWRPTWDGLPQEMKTVLVAFTHGGDPVSAYWDGEDWYCTDGHALDQVAWWAELPIVPPPLE